MNAVPIEITALLARWKTGDRSVENDLLVQVYPVLLDLARAQIRRNSGVLTLQTTELANEAYARLHAQQSVDWQNRDHFFAIAATVIRRVVVDHLRQRGAEKRGGGLPFISLDDITESQTPAIDESVDWIAVDQALTDLAEVDAECARVVELKFFSGLTTERIAEVCGSSVATVGRQWRFSRAWLGQRLGIDSAGA
ncbi:MAG: ECF-type sigma factor [Pseudomonadota bacterium]|nr:ECF-type sigma factor [Pseudomonadota bacterium]